MDEATARPDIEKPRLGSWVPECRSESGGPREEREDTIPEEHPLTQGRLPNPGFHRGGAHPETPPISGCWNQVQDQDHRQGH
jgi:hypothetical protein